jgi:hypothetical protein
MKATKLLAAALVAITAGAVCAATKDYPVSPVSFKDVHVTGGFWQQKLDNHRS